MSIAKSIKFLIVGFLLILALTSLFHAHHLEIENSHPCLACQAVQVFILATGLSSLLAVFHALASVFAFEVFFQKLKSYSSFFLRAPPAHA